MELRERIEKICNEALDLEGLKKDKYISEHFPQTIAEIEKAGQEITDSLLSLLNEEVKKARIEELEQFLKSIGHMDNNAVYIGHKYLDRITQLRSKE